MTGCGDNSGRVRRRFAVFALVCLGVLGLLGFRCSGARGDEASPRLRIVVFGDSQAQGIAGGLSRDLIDDPRFRVLNRTHPGAALVHDEAEWAGPIRKFLAQEKADIAVVMLGANDRLDIKNSDSGKYLHFRSAEWREEYVKRVDTIMSALVEGGLEVIWCGNPIARSDTYSSDMKYINQIFAERAEHFGIQFLPLWQAIAGDDGSYAAYGKDLAGVTQRLRTDDGIHFTAAGYQLIAEKIIGHFPANAADGK